MWIIGCDYHPGVRQISFVDQETGECGKVRLEHKNGEAEQFYRKPAGQKVRVGVEATGRMRWFERLLGELGFELWVGDPVKIKAAAAGRPHRDPGDADLILRLLEDRFPKIWVPSQEERDATAVGAASTSAGANADAGQNEHNGEHTYRMYPSFK